MAVEERGSLHICGYPICSKSLPQSGRFKIDSSFGLFDSRKFDIIPCEVNPKKYLKQLSKKPTVFEQENKTELMTNYIDSLIQSFSSTTLSTIKIHEKLESTSMDVKTDQQVSTDQATIERLMNEYVTPSTTILKSFQPSLETNPNQNIQHDMVEGYQVKYYGKKISTPKSKDSKQKVKKIRKPILTLFGETWTLLNAIVSTDTKEFVKHIHLDSNHTSHPLHQTNTIELQRNLIFCTRIQSQ
ncbi:hypothetical protein HDV02_001607 [Globomyces sp. JEL0801]|nr:hypothetical protein HDV02_001607 [Globomyces sp. JEL0801]